MANLEESIQTRMNIPMTGGTAAALGLQAARGPATARTVNEVDSQNRPPQPQTEKQWTMGGATTNRSATRHANDIRNIEAA